MASKKERKSVTITIQFKLAINKRVKKIFASVQDVIDFLKFVKIVS